VYEEARARAVEAKDALRSALTDRDALTEVLRSSPYTTKTEADAQLKNVQDKVEPSAPLPPAIAALLPRPWPPLLLSPRSRPLSSPHHQGSVPVSKRLSAACLSSLLSHFCAD
jgi:hypothetical protein